MKFLKIKELNIALNKDEILRVQYIPGEKQTNLLYIGDKIIITHKNGSEHIIKSDKPNGLKKVMEMIYKKL